jgi:hypothetical protein
VKTYREECTRTQDGELREQQRRGNRVNHKHRTGISGNEGVDLRQPEVREGSSYEEKGDKQEQHDAKSESLLRQAWRQARKDKVLLL